MAKRKVTVQLDDDVIHRATIAAAKRGTSVSGGNAGPAPRIVAAHC